jgi:hypothetical protein
LSRSLLGEPTEQVIVGFQPFDAGTSWRTVTLEQEQRNPETDTETSDTQASYQTAPVLSEPVEHLFDALLDQNEPRNPWRPPTPERRNLNDTDTETQTDKSIEINMAGEGMSIDTAPKERTNELKLNAPKQFTGKRSDVDEFVEMITLYIEINEDTYNTDKKKIGYALSFMDEGDAKSWRSQFLKSTKTPAGGRDLGTWTKFIADLEEAFKPYDTPGDALEELTSLKMGTNSIEDHTA